jgi:hypothetical protein
MVIIPVMPRDLKPLFPNNKSLIAFMRGLLGKCFRRGKQ